MLTKHSSQRWTMLMWLVLPIFLPELWSCLVSSFDWLGDFLCCFETSLSSVGFGRGFELRTSLSLSPWLTKIEGLNQS